MRFPEPSFARSTALQARLHELVPGGAHTYARAPTSTPSTWRRCSTAARRPGLGRRRQRIRRVRHGPAVGDARARLRAGASTRSATTTRRGVNFARPDRARARGGRGVPRRGARRGHGQVRQERLGRDHRGGAAGPRRHRPRLVAICATSRSSPPTTGSSAPPPMDAGIPAAKRRLTVSLPLQRSGLGRGAVRRSIRAGSPALILEAATGHCEPEPGFLERVRAPVRPRRARAHLRRDDHRVPLAAGRRPGALRRRPDLSTCGKALGNGFAVVRAGRPPRAHGARRAAHRRAAGVPALDHQRRRRHRLAAYRAVVAGLPRRDVVADDGAAGPRGSPTASTAVADARARRARRRRRPAVAAMVFVTRDRRGAPSQAVPHAVPAGDCSAAACWRSRSSSAPRTPTPTSTGRWRRSADALTVYAKALEPARATACSGAARWHRRCARAPRRAAGPASPSAEPARAARLRGSRRRAHHVDAVVAGGELLGHRREVRAALEIAQCRSGASESSWVPLATAHHILDVDGPEVDGKPGVDLTCSAPSSAIGCRRTTSGRPARGPGGPADPTPAALRAFGWSRVSVLRMWLSRGLAAGAVPLVVVVATRPVLHRRSPRYCGWKAITLSATTG